jgi:hypothetical protein
MICNNRIAMLLILLCSIGLRRASLGLGFICWIWIYTYVHAIQMDDSAPVEFSECNMQWTIMQNAQTNKSTWGKMEKFVYYNPKSLYPPIKINISSLLHCWDGKTSKPGNCLLFFKSSCLGANPSHHYAWATFSSHSFAPDALMYVIRHPPIICFNHTCAHWNI